MVCETDKLEISEAAILRREDHGKAYADRYVYRFYKPGR